MFIIDNITENNHFAEIKRISSTSDEMTIVSPFCFGNFEDFYGSIANSGIKTIIQIIHK